MAVSSTGSLASPGLGSGLDVNAIVSKLMAVESQPLTALATKEASYQAQITAFGTLKGGLGALQTALAGLARRQEHEDHDGEPSPTRRSPRRPPGSAPVPGSYSLKVNAARAGAQGRVDRFRAAPTMRWAAGR